MFKSLKFRLLTSVLGVALSVGALAPRTAHASVDQALQNLLGGETDVTTNGSGYYQSEARGSFVAGGADVRFPSQTFPSLFSMTLPSFSAGCGGISVFFGGFSFISGDQIKQMIQSVAQDSVGMAIDLAMTTLCAPCAHVMQVMRALAKDAANTSINSCQMARSLMDRGYTKLFGHDPTYSDKEQDTCTLTASSKGATSDFLSGLQDVCQEGQAAESWLQNSLNGLLSNSGTSPTSANGTAFLCKAGSECNTIWTALNQTPLQGDSSDNIRAKLILMNVIGTNVYCGGDAACESAATASNSSTGSSSSSAATVQNDVATYPPLLGNLEGNSPQMDSVFTLFMCGTNWQNASTNGFVQSVVNTFCADGGKGTQVTADLNNLKVWDCASSGGAFLGSGNYDTCYYLKQTTLGQSGMADNGYLPYVANLLEEGVTAVQGNSPMPTAVIQLIQLMPAPVYEAINDAAVYPAAGQQLLAEMSVYCAQLLVDADLKEVLREAAQISPNVAYSPAEMERFYSFLSGMRATIDKQQIQYAQAVTMQETLMQQIRELNVTMQKDVLSQDLLGASQFSSALVNSSQGGP